MSTFSFSKNGYNYFLEPCGEGYYQLRSDVEYLQYLQANETKPGIITSITNGEIIVMTLGEKFEDNFVSEIQRLDGNPPTFKVKLQKNKP